MGQRVKECSFKPHDLSLIPRTPWRKERTNLMTSPYSLQFPSPSTYTPVSGKTWSTVRKRRNSRRQSTEDYPRHALNAIQILRNSTSQMSDILESQCAMGKSWMYKLLFLLEKPYLNLSLFACDSEDKLFLSAHPASCLQGSRGLMRPQLLQSLPSLLPLHSRHWDCSFARVWGTESGPHTWVTSALPIFPDPLI